MAININEAITVPPRVDYGANITAPFAALMTACTDVGSVYEAAIAMIEDVADQYGAEVPLNELSRSERAKIAAMLAAEMVAALTPDCMAAAADIVEFQATFPYTIGEIMADGQYTTASAVAAQNETAAIENDKIRIAHMVLQGRADLERTYGLTAPFQGWADMTAWDALNLRSGESSKNLEVASVKAQITATAGRMGREYGKNFGSVVNYDSYFTVNESDVGISEVQDTLTADELIETRAIRKGLVHNQTAAQWRQYEAFQDNIKQHVVNSASNVMGISKSAGLDLSSVESVWMCVTNDLLSTVSRNEYVL